MPPPERRRFSAGPPAERSEGGGSRREEAFLLRPSSSRPRWSLVAVAIAALTILSSSLPPAVAGECGIISWDDDGGGGGDDGDDERTLYVHVVPHTHDDVGWLKTVDQYYYGFNNTIQRAQVRYILDTVVMALRNNPNRTFTYVETAFFSRWWNEQSDATKDDVRDLADGGRLSFANGGWCMHDEAATHYMGMVDQTTLGHSFLKRELGVVPRVGWQLDPFGHSATQASLLTSRAGFDALYFGRIDHQDLEKRQSTQQCEGFWSPSPNLDDAKVFWGLTGSYGGNYGPPPGFCFDTNCNDDYLIGEDEALLKERLLDFLRDVGIQSGRTKGQHVMLTMGEDFQYENAFINFENYDLLIDSVMRYQASGEIDVPSIFAPRFDRLKIFYSTPELYTECKHRDFRRMTAQRLSPADGSAGDEPKTKEATAKVEEEEEPWDVKTDDFFPYSDCDHCFWTGYFTSRPALKRLERAGSSFLHAARQIESYSASTKRRRAPGEGEAEEEDGDGSPLARLDEAMGVAQHHDAVSGTSKQHVAYDYAKRIQGGINDAEEYIVRALRDLLLDDKSADMLDDLMFCQLLNVTMCQVSQDATKTPGRDVYVVVYNALGRRDEFVTVPVAADADYTVEKLIAGGNGEGLGEQWEAAPSVLIPNANPAGTDGAAPFVLHFDAGPLPPVGAAVFRIRAAASAEESAPTHEAVARGGKRESNAAIAQDAGVAVSPDRRSLRAVASAAPKVSELNQVISNGHVRVHFDSGSITKITSAVDASLDVDVTLEWGYYTSFDSGPQNSGAYIFRPKTPDQELRVVAPDPSKSHVFKSSLVTEVHVGFEEPWIKQITRIKSGQPYVEVEYTVGPIPVDDGIGREVVARYKSGIGSDGEFRTDSNGREFVRRKRGYRPTWDLKETEPVAGNFYPVNAAIHIEDDDASLSVLVDRSQGGASLADGSVELMVHRRTVADDARGVGEPINETDAGMTPYPPFGDAKRLGKGIVVTGVHRIMLGRGRNGAALARSLMDKTFSPPHVFAASAPSSARVLFKSSSFSALRDDLPKNVMLITYSKTQSSSETLMFLVRLGHQYAKGEDEELSKPAEVDMGKLLAGYDVVSVVEKTLSGNQDYVQWEESRLKWDKPERDMAGGAALRNETVVQLKPMEIRTFEVKVSR